MVLDHRILENKKPPDYLVNFSFFDAFLQIQIQNKELISRSKTLLQAIKSMMMTKKCLDNEILKRMNMQNIQQLSKPLKISNLFSFRSLIKNNYHSINIFGDFSKKTLVYSIIFFFALNATLNAELIPKKTTPKAPIIYGMPISKIILVVGQISLIRYPKIQDIAEMIMSIIPIIPIIKNPFFVSIFYSLSSIINILINIRLSSSILYKMEESPFSFDFEQKLSFFGGYQ